MSRRDTAAVAGVAACLAFAGVMFGGATRYTACAISALALAAAFTHQT
jgi:hypothetical protein